MCGWRSREGAAGLTADVQSYGPDICNEVQASRVSNNVTYKNWCNRASANHKGECTATAVATCTLFTLALVGPHRLATTAAAQIG